MAASKKDTPQVKSILITQPRPETEKSPYFDLAQKLKVKIDFHPFIEIEGIDARDFRKAKINPADFTAIIFTSRNAIDHFFRICTDLRCKMPPETKYFCASETIAVYLQKYILYRKRKVFFGKTSTSKELMEILKKHKEEKFMLPCTDIHKQDIPDFLKKNKFNFLEATIYKTVCSELSGVNIKNYDMIVFFSPSGVKSLFHNFPDYKQDKMLIGAFGPTTCKAVTDAGLRLDVKAPAPNAPSMTMAIEKYIKG